jgi:hypothetical protein
LTRGSLKLRDGPKDMAELSPKQRFQLRHLQSEALKEHTEHARAAMDVRKKRHRKHQVKKHAGLVLVPPCLRAPYGTSLIFTNSSRVSGFVEGDRRVPQQPNGEATFADRVNGVAGQTMLWDHASGFGSFGDTAFLDVTRGALVGGWLRADYGSPPILDAHLTAIDVGGQAAGNVYWFGGGSALYQVLAEINVFSAATQTTLTPPVPVASGRDAAFDIPFASLGQNFRTTLAVGTTKNPWGTASSVPQGAWMLVLAGPVTRFFASLSHADWVVSANSRWSVDRICCYW